MYTIEYEMDGGVLVVSVSGAISSGEQAVEKALKVVGMGLKAGVNRVLLDERELNISVDVHGIVNVANELEKRDILYHGGRMACLYRAECRDIYQVYETVYKNRSLSYQLFDDPDKALAWLRE